MRLVSRMAQITDNTVLELGKRVASMLSGKQEDLSKVRWTDGESNLESGFSKLACECCELAWVEHVETHPEFEDVRLRCTSPDLTAIFNLPGEEVRKKIELKSSMSKKLPGSTIKGLDANQVLIYCLRPRRSGTYSFRCSQYHSAMGKSDTELFQDRSPRPWVSFEQMPELDEERPFEHKEGYDWIQHYAECALRRIDVGFTGQASWQDSLVKLIREPDVKLLAERDDEILRLRELLAERDDEIRRQEVLRWNRGQATKLLAQGELLVSLGDLSIR